MVRLLIISFLFVPVFVFAQGETYDLKNPYPDLQGNCTRCFQAISQKPQEVMFGVDADPEGNIYFYLSDAACFDKLFTKGSDGIAIDIVSKTQFSCGQKNTFTNWASRGHLLKPVYLKELKKNQIVTEQNVMLVKVGTLPEKFKHKEIELNLVFIYNKYPCYNHYAVHVESSKWDLLDMGLYLDTITYMADFNGRDSNNVFHINSKKLKFLVPFEKSKSEFSAADVKPIFDSLNLTDYNITNISIRAFSSVEGNEEKNIQLQEARAKSIVSALQTYQSPSITTDIEAAENWVEFLNDITGTPFAYMGSLSKSEIKQKLENKDLSKTMEPILKNHRKAVLLIDLEKKNELKALSGDELKTLFETSVAENNVKRAKEIQEAVFDKIKDEELPVTYLNKLEIPRQNEYGVLLNNATGFGYLMNQDEVYETILAFQDLQDLMPKNGKIRYNITALKFRSWLNGSSDLLIDPVKFKQEIAGLKAFGIPQSLINRMMMNYNIVMTEYNMMMRNYQEKDKSLKFINDNYKKTEVREEDAISLSQYFSAYAKFDWAAKLLEPYAKKIDVNEDLLFNYLHLTILDKNKTKQPEYRKILINAYNINKQRFCLMFASSRNGGASFQLLENEFLKKSYCESCN